MGSRVEVGVGVEVVVGVGVDLTNLDLYHLSMSYVMPPNNNIAALLDQDRNDDARRAIFETDLALQLADHNNTPGGAGPVRGWGRRSYRRR